MSHALSLLPARAGGRGAGELCQGARHEPRSIGAKASLLALAQLALPILREQSLDVDPAPHPPCSSQLVLLCAQARVCFTLVTFVAATRSVCATSLPSRVPKSHPSLAPSYPSRPHRTSKSMLKTTIALSLVGAAAAGIYSLPLLQNNGANPTRSQDLCQGDCDVDSDCDVGLVCFQSNHAGQTSGSVDNAYSRMPGGCYSVAYWVTYNTDYCVDPSKAPMWMASERSYLNPLLEDYGSEPMWTPGGTSQRGGTRSVKMQSTTLGNCKGDCDSNADCNAGLECFQRDGTTAVPGCKGTGITGHDCECTRARLDCPSFASHISLTPHARWSSCAEHVFPIQLRFRSVCSPPSQHLRTSSCRLHLPRRSRSKTHGASDKEPD